MQGLLLRRAAHPVELLDASLVCAAHILDDLLVAFLGRLVEILLHEQLPEGFAHRALFGVQHPLPAGALLLRAADRAVVELEVGVHERLAEVGSERANEMKGHVVFQGLDVFARDDLAQLLVELGLSHDDAVHVAHAEPVQVDGPVDGRRQRVQLRDRHLVVVLVRIAQVRKLARRAREPRLQGHNRRGLASGLCAVIAHQDEYRSDIFRVLGAHLRRARVGVEIVFAVRHAETALRHVEGVSFAVLLVLGDFVAIEYSDAVCMHARRLRHHVPGRLQVSYLVQLVAQRLEADLLDRHGIHSGIPEIAYLLGDARFFVLGHGLFIDVQQAVVELLLHEAVDAPARFVRGYGVVLHPAAVGVVEEIVRGIDRRIQIGHEDVRPRGSFRGRLPGGHHERRRGQDDEKALLHSTLLCKVRSCIRGFTNQRMFRPERPTVYPAATRRTLSPRHARSAGHTSRRFPSYAGKSPGPGARPPRLR